MALCPPLEPAAGRLTLGKGEAVDEGRHLSGQRRDSRHVAMPDGTERIAPEGKHQRHRLGKVVAALESRLPFWPRLTDDRRRVLANMGYQLGVGGLMGFKRMLAALERGDYEAAAREMLDSKWAKRDTPARAGRLAERMRRG